MRTLLFLLASGVTACGAILGIDSVTLDVAAADAATTTDAPPPSNGPPREAGPAADGSACSGDRTRCVDCCRKSNLGAPPLLEDAMRASGCFCGGGSTTCETECSASACGAAPAAPDMTCVECLNALLKSPSCAGAIEQCHADRTCAPLATCIATCP